MGGIDLSTTVWRKIAPLVVIAIHPDQAPYDLLRKAILDLVPYTPRDEVICFRSKGDLAVMEDMSTRFPKLRALHSGLVPLPAAFPGSSLDGNGGIPAFLQHIHLERPIVNGGNWSPLTDYLACRSSSGNRLDSLALDRSPHMRRDVEEYIRSMVREFRITYQEE